MTKIAFVCQRYGEEVNGGAELHCRQVAERLSGLYDVTVYTTCALDYVTWANHYMPGTEIINGVRVIRFRVEAKRNDRDFARISRLVMNIPHTDAQEDKWIDKQGPLCPQLIEALKQEYDQYTVVFFMTYLYYTTARGLPLGFPNAALIPTVHDEPPVYLRYYDKVFAAAKSIVWNTETERRFAEGRFPFLLNTPGDIVGVGIECPTGELPPIPKELKSGNFLVYAGRIDESKGCAEMFQYFRKYKKRHPSDLQLVLMGKPVMDVPKESDIVNLGFVSEEMKFAVMAESLSLVLFSRFESLSMVVLESLLMGRPVLVSEHCEVLKGHCIKSNAGLYFNNFNEFEATVNWMLSHPEEYAVMRENGKKYVEENYRWNVIIEKYRKLIQGFSERKG